jgi:hypothetical protein
MVVQRLLLQFLKLVFYSVKKISAKTYDKIKNNNNNAEIINKTILTISLYIYFKLSDIY